jgi:glycosyltransferase involved in cell wall biosynthesis
MRPNSFSPASGAPLRRVAFVGNYLPRQCGIATFTTHLCESLASRYTETDFIALPVTDVEEGYAYPARVRFELIESKVISYRSAADFLNIHNVELLCLQHEFGIFGGPAGSHILALIREVRMPLVTTLHTVLSEPDGDQRKVLCEIADRSDRVVVMSERGREFLLSSYRVPEKKIDMIPHGIPDVPFIDPNFYKDQFGVEGKTVLLTFGLISPNKGIETVIKALPSVLQRYPETVYIVLGATHPNVKRWDGESYRLRLQRVAREYGVEGNVIFHNRFVSAEELNEFIGAADVYITPYLNRAQIVSGTLAYTVGAGKAVVSTPYWYAEELLSEGCGVLVPFGDPEAMAGEICNLLANEAQRHAMRKRGYLKGRDMIWPAVAELYMKSFELAREGRLRHPHPAYVARTLDQAPDEMPIIKLDHMQRLTDDTGILQHALFTVPNYNEGYATDDNARALIVSTLLESLGEQVSLAHALASRFLAFLWYAFDHRNGYFRNFLGFDRRWLENRGSDDSHSRALWGLGMVMALSKHAGLKALAGRLFGLALPKVPAMTSPRAWAYALLGMDGYLKEFSGDRAAQNARQTLTTKLLDLFDRTASGEWLWFENVLTYANASLAHGLLVAGAGMRRDDALEVGLKTLGWLVEKQRDERGHFVPVGSNGFYPRGGERARFDQQPIEADVTISACLEAYRLTGDSQWHKEARRAFEWFLGRNDLGVPLYDPASGGCCDGLHADRVNQNQGAESTLAFLHSLLELRLAENIIETPDRSDGYGTYSKSSFSAAPAQSDFNG